MTVAETPWDIEAEKLKLETGAPLDVCRDQVILAWMRQGDIRPLADWLVADHKPGGQVLWELGIMLHDDDEAAGQLAPLMDDAGGKFGQSFRYRLETRARRGKEGRPSNPEVPVRDELIAKRVKSHMQEGRSYAASVAQVKKEIQATRYRISTATIRRAYDSSRHGKK